MDIQTSFKQTWYAPVISSLIANRREGLIIAGAAGVHISLYLAGLPAWACPIRAATGVPCPGCGLTTATSEFLHGDISTSLQTHAFTPIFVLGIVFLGIASVLPNHFHKSIVDAVSRFEKKTGILSWVLSGLVFYWGARLIGLLPYNIPGY